ncbi:Transposable element Tc1 transposase [Araneus ventricosus]|uniref:Transposable element Tc1 transposase n=1 Tax=Araneus ventricosus TaxID=182803 RepID=A0A4Y2C786_ARAVE|nr:Transposable element Tc1 transposase [Araneus ventricosus]
MGYSEFVRPQVPDPTMKHGGGNVMVWRCVSRRGLCPLTRIQGIMDKFQYEDILKNIMRPYAGNSFGRGFIFQQDNGSKYRYTHIQKWFSRRHVTLLDWPSRSQILTLSRVMGRAGASSCRKICKECR